MYNLYTWFNNLLGVSVNWFTVSPLSWLATMMPLGILMLPAQIRSAQSVGRAAGLLLPLLLIYILVHPDLEYRYRIDYLYFLFSSGVAYCCYLKAIDRGALKSVDFNSSQFRI